MIESRAEADEDASELWRVPFAGWDVVHVLRARAGAFPGAYIVVDADGLVRATGYTVKPTCFPGRPFRLTVPSPNRMKET